MIWTLRKKFIRITMLSVFAVLFLIVFVINFWNVRQNSQSLDMVSELLLKGDGSFGQAPPASKPGENPSLPGDKSPKPDGNQNFSGDRFHNKDELPFSTRFFTVRFDGEGGISDLNLSNIASVNEEDARAYAETILQKNTSTGWYKTFRYRVGQTDSGLILIAIEATTAQETIRSVFSITLIVALSAFTLIFLLVAIFSKRAIKPILEAYDRQKQFITDASHELKTPLTVIAADAELLNLTYGENEWSSGITKQTELLRALISKMIQMSKLDEGKPAESFDSFPIGDAVFDTAMSFRGLASSKGLTMTVDTDAAKDLTCFGDEASIRQAVAILVDNAVKYCDPDGEIRVFANPVRSIGKEKIAVSVENSFAEVSSLDLSKVFERFYRADKARTSGNSFGLGLPIAKSIAELHGGTIYAENVSGKAIRFTLTLGKKHPNPHRRAKESGKNGI